MDQYQETFETWNKVAALYEEKFMHLQLYDPSYDSFCNALKPNQVDLLEIGCGPGNITHYLLKKRAIFKIDGIDVAPNMIELAIKNNPSVNFKVMDVRNLDELQKQYHAIVCGFCLPYLSVTDCEKFFKDCNKLLLEEGLIYLSFVEGANSQSGFQTGSSGDRVYFYFHEINHVFSMLDENNFQVIESFKFPYQKSDNSTETHIILIVKKGIAVEQIL